MLAIRLAAAVASIAWLGTLETHGRAGQHRKGSPTTQERTAATIHLADPPRCVVNLRGFPQVVLLTDGRLAAVESGARMLKLFDCSGRLLRAVGENGTPTPFIEVQRLVRLPGDSILVAHGSSASIFNPAGEFTRRIEVGNILCALADGSFLVRGRMAVGASAAAAPPAGPVRRPEIYLHASLASVDTIGVFPGEAVVALGRDNARDRAGGGSTSNVLVTRAPFVALTFPRCDSTRIIVADAAKSELLAYASSGRLERTIAVGLTSNRLTKAHIDAFRTEELAGLDRGMSVVRRRQLDALSYPDTLPMFRDVQIDDRHRFWLSDFPTNDKLVDWRVFDSDGRSVARARLPRELRVLAITESSIVMLRYQAPTSQVFVYDLVTDRP